MCRERSPSTGVTNQNTRCVMRFRLDLFAVAPAQETLLLLGHLHQFIALAELELIEVLQRRARCPFFLMQPPALLPDIFELVVKPEDLKPVCLAYRVQR